MLRSSFSVGLVAAAAVGLLGAGCGKKRDADSAQRSSDEATAEAEQRAQEASVTSAPLERDAGSREAQRAAGEVGSAYRFEEAEFRGRLGGALDQLDSEIVRARAARRGDRRTRELRARRDLLKSDLQALDRSTEQDWATLRTKVQRDLDTGSPGTQLAPRSEATGQP